MSDRGRVDATVPVAVSKTVPETRYGLDWKVEDAIERNAKTMKFAEYAWLKAQDFQPPIRRALIAEYERALPSVPAPQATPRKEDSHE